MRTYNIPATVLAAVLLLGGCSRDHETEIAAGRQDNATDDPAAVIGLIDGTTRTTLDLSRNVVWTSGDEIRLFGASATAGKNYKTTSNNTRTGIFTPVDAINTVDDETRYAVYPASAASASTLAGSTLEVDLTGLSSQPYVASLGAGADISGVPMVATSGNNSFSFRNICGGVQLRLNDYQALGIKVKSVAVTAKGNEQIAGRVSVDASSGAVTVSKTGSLNTVTVNCGDGANISSGGSLTKPTGFIAFLPAGEYASGLDFVITDTEGRRYEIATVQAVTVTAGTVTPLHALPLTIYYGTANCCLTAAAAGTIDIDATPYYTFGETYVHENLKCVNAGGSVVGAPTKTKIVWQQGEKDVAGDVVSSVSVTGTTLKVTKTGKAGNALVAVCDASDNILWSYHVWVASVSDVTYTNSPKGTFQMMDRHLGATSTTPKDRNAYGLFYQWGRKDPMARNLTAPYPAPGNTPTYGNDPSPLQKSTGATAETGTIAWANQHPDTRLLSSADWYMGAGSNDLLWGWIDANSGVKTVYDPCPAGYRVGDYNCFAELIPGTSADCNAQYGHMMVTDGGSTKSYYPTGGYLIQNSDFMQYMEFRGYVWNNQPATGPNGTDSATPNRFMYNNAGITKVKGEYRAAGMSIRCVKIQ